MSTDLDFEYPLDGINNYDLAYIVGLPLPGFERFGRIRQIQATQYRRGATNVGFATEEACPGDRSGWHFIKDLHTVETGRTLENYIRSECPGCGCIARPQVNTRRWQPTISYEPDGRRVPGAGEGASVLAYGFATEAEALACAFFTIKWQDEQLGPAPWYAVQIAYWDRPRVEIRAGEEIVSDVSTIRYAGPFEHLDGVYAAWLAGLRDPQTLAHVGPGPTVHPEGLW